MKLQRLYSYVRQAMDDYHMVEDGDRIAVGISGGKDSLTLLYALAGLRKFYPHPFEIAALTVDLGYEGFDLTEIEKLCRNLDVEYHIIHTEIGKMVPNGQCSLCARLRKGALNEKAVELGCNKIAYAHNQDDVVETMMLSLIYEGRFSTFWPVTALDIPDPGKKVTADTSDPGRKVIEDTSDPGEKLTEDTSDPGGNTAAAMPALGKKTASVFHLTVIRPLIYVSLAEVIGFRNKYHLPVTANPCPYDKITERTYVRGLLQEMNQHAPGVKKRMMTAIRSGQIPEWSTSESSGISRGIPEKNNESSSSPDESLKEALE